LFSSEVWNQVRRARPFHDYPEKDVNPEEAFADYWVNFSHFTELGDQDSLNMTMLYAAILRGSGIKPCPNEKVLDLVIPIFRGSPTDTQVTKDRLSFVQFWFNNTRKAEKVTMDSSLLQHVPQGCCVLSIVMELGVAKSIEDKAGQRVAITSKKGGDNTPADYTHHENIDATNIKHQHYMITVYDCTSYTYRCVPEGSDIYRTLLAAQKPLEGFSRSKNHEAMYEMKPRLFHSEVLSNLSWTNE
jgi:hypothetical protein